MSTDDLDHLRLAVELADEAGLSMCLSCAARGRRPDVGRDGGGDDELSPFAVAAVELLIGEGAARRWQGVSGVCAAPAGAARRLFVLASVVAAFLPVPPDVAAPPELRGGHDGDDEGPECFCRLEGAVTGALHTLARHLGEHDAGDWIDPDAMAGAVEDVRAAAADLVDALVAASTRCDH